MTTQLEDRLRTDLRSRAAAESPSPFDGCAVLSAGRAVRTRRRLAWASGGLVAAIAVSAFAVVARPSLLSDPPPGPAASPAVPQRADIVLLSALGARDFRVGKWRTFTLQGGGGYGHWELRQEGRRYGLMLAIHRDLDRAGGFPDRCEQGTVTCGPARVALGPKVSSSPAWTQTITDVSKGDDFLAGGRILERVYRSGNVLELAVSPQEDRRLGDDEFGDPLLTQLADAIGDPFPS